MTIDTSVLSCCFINTREKWPQGQKNENKSNYFVREKKTFLFKLGNVRFPSGALLRGYTEEFGYSSSFECDTTNLEVESEYHEFP